MTRPWIVTTCLVVVLAVPVSALAIDAPSTTPAQPVEQPVDTPTAEPTAEATDEARQVRRDLRDLARAWAEGGGRFGYPFWEKAGQRWEDRQITTAMYREYVTGYRDRLRAGCDLLDSVDIETAEARDVRSLALDACRSRVDALRVQQSWLDDLIRRDSAAPGDQVDVAELQSRIEERETEWNDLLQRSYRDARLATDLAQRELDESGLERIAEDAFI